MTHERTTWAGDTTGKQCTLCGKPAQVTKWNDGDGAVPYVRLCHEHRNLSIGEVLESIAGTWNEIILANEARAEEDQETEEFYNLMAEAQ